MGKKRHYCGFCGKSDEETEQPMLAGPCIEVCVECIDTMYKMAHEPKPLLPVKPASKPHKVISFKEAAARRRS